MLVDALRKLRICGEEQTESFDSEGFQELFARVKTEFNEKYLHDIHAHLNDLRFLDGTLFTGELGEGNKGTDYILRKPPVKRSRLQRLFGRDKNPGLTFRLHPRVQPAAKALCHFNQNVTHQVATLLYHTP